MNRKQSGLIMVLATLAGFVGGVLASLFLISEPAFAEKKPARIKASQSERFEVVDSNGKVRMVMGLSPSDTAPQGSPSIKLFDKDGRLRALMDLAPTLGDMPTMGFYDADGNIIWKAP